MNQLETQIWSMFDILRNENISTEDYYVALLFLSAYNDGLIKTDKHLSNQNQLEGLLEGKLNDNFKKIVSIYEPVIQRLSNEGIKNLIGVLNGLDKEELSENFSDVFDSILYKLSQSEGRFSSDTVQPLEITRLMLSLAKPLKKAKVYNPFAGQASFGVHLDDENDFFAQEFNSKTWAIGTLRLMAYKKLDKVKYYHEDSIFEWPDSTEKFDLIISNPPMGMRIDFEKIKSIDHFILEKGLNALNEKGKMVLVLPTGVLSSGAGGLRQFREFLIENDLIETVISLPGGLLYNTGVSLAILVINKNKNTKGRVSMLDAKKYVEDVRNKVKVLNDTAILDLLNGKIEDEDSFRIVDFTQIKAYDYMLNVPLYFQKQIIGVRLGDILTPINGNKNNLPEIGKVVRAGNLKDDFIDYLLDTATLKDKEPVVSGYYKICESCLLLASRMRSLKPTLFDYKGDSIFIDREILAFKIDETKVDRIYLINELHADYVKEQVDAYRMGAVVPYLRSKDLFEVIIKLPSIEEQRAKVEGIVELSEKYLKLKQERNALAHGQNLKLYENFSTVKHALGKPLLNIGSSLRNIEKALTGLNSDWEQLKLSERYEITVKDSFNSIYDNLELIHALLKKNDSSFDVSNYTLTEVDFLKFIKNYVNQLKSSAKNNISIIFEAHPDIEKQLNNEVVIQSNYELLEIGFNTIVENAYMHAFTDFSKRYKLVFRISLYVAHSIKSDIEETIGRFNYYIKVEVANNGTPFPVNFSIDKFIRKNSFAGETGNTGQGGFDLNEIIKYHNNGISTLELITNDLDSEFTTTYSFLIPIYK